MTKTEAEIIRKLYIFKHASVPIRPDSYEESAADRLAEHSIVRLVEDGDERLWAEPFELKETP